MNALKPSPIQKEKAESAKATGPILRDWYWFSDRIVNGAIYNDPKRRWPDGERIYTSTVQWIDERCGLLQTLNTLYLLRDKR